MRLQSTIVCTIALLAMSAAYMQADSPLYQSKWTIEQLSNSIVPPLTAAGDLNSDEVDDYLVVFYSTFGGSGSFMLAIVRFSSSGSWVDTKPFDMPDRVGIDKTSIRKGVISLDMVVHGEGDGACCPSVKTVWKLRLDGTKLVKFEGIEDTY